MWSPPLRLRLLAPCTALALAAPPPAHAERPLPAAAPLLDTSPPPEASFGPAPFLDTAPLLPEIRTLLARSRPDRRALTSALHALDDWISRAPSQDSGDPLALATAQWLRARVLTNLRKTRESTDAWETIAVQSSPFSDFARTELASRAAAQHDLTAAAHYRLSRAPWTPGFLADARTSARDLVQRHEAPRALTLLRAALDRGMSPSLRAEIVLILADTLARSGDPAAARTLLQKAWWQGGGAPVTRALAALDAAPTPAETLFLEALDASRTGCARLAKSLPARPRSPLAIATRALVDRWDSDLTPALTALTTAEEALPTPPADPLDPTYLALTRGLLLRKLDRDADALAAFSKVIQDAPDHPLALIARDNAASLLRAADRPADANLLDLALLELALPGDFHRNALWRLGFSAVLANDPPRAELFLRELEWRHGGDPDAHSISWFERARYWRGRAAALTPPASSTRSKPRAAPRTLTAAARSGAPTPNPAAAALWQDLIRRYPAGWYALLARARLGLPPTPRPAPATWDLAPDDPMATAIALYRLGDEARARTEFQALLDASQLPGNGRRLLADLYEITGDSRRAEQALRFAAIPPTMPGEDPDATYFNWYPLRFEDALGDAAQKNNLPSSLLAGVVSVETRFSATARSHAGAVGAAQLLVSTGTAIGRKVFGPAFDARTLTDPDVNLAVAARYLSDLLTRFNHHPALAVAAYNAGPGNVNRWLASRGDLELDAFVETIPFTQARRYVMRVMSEAEIYRRLYGLDATPAALPLTFDTR